MNNNNTQYLLELEIDDNMPNVPLLTLEELDMVGYHDKDCSIHTYHLHGNEKCTCYVKDLTNLVEWMFPLCK